MKISASIYSDKKRNLTEVIKDLNDNQVDLLHVDCNDDLDVFNDIKIIRNLSDIPIDLHIITENPSKYYKLLEENPVEYLTFQHEQLKEPLNIPNTITGKRGIAITSKTPISIFDQYSKFDFILIMATTPGMSGGDFNTINFTKIRQFRNHYPDKSIHVDGGVTAEVSFIIRNMGVSVAVSGSYLFSSPTIGNALMNLTRREIESHFSVSDFMVPISESPKVLKNNITFQLVLESIDNGKLGFCLVLDKNNKLLGLVSNADVRKTLLNNIDDFNNLSPLELINFSPITINDNATVYEMLRLIKKCKFPILYLPVIDNKGFAKGIVTFVNLIKGEL